MTSHYGAPGPRYLQAVKSSKLSNLLNTAWSISLVMIVVILSVLALMFSVLLFLFMWWGISTLVGLIF